MARAQEETINRKSDGMVGGGLGVAFKATAGGGGIGRGTPAAYLSFLLPFLYCSVATRVLFSTVREGLIFF